MFDHFDTACIARLTSNVVRTISSYKHLESQYGPRELGRFHTEGYDANLDISYADPSLQVWRGFESLEQSLIGLLNLRNKSELIHYGATTAEIFESLVNTLSGHSLRTLWTDEFYPPWASRLADASAHGQFNGVRIPVRSRIIRDKANGPEGLAHWLANAIVQEKPQVVLLSIVTQGGVRMPVEIVLQHLLDAWDVGALGDYPLFILDGCQAFARAPTDFGDPIFRLLPCAYIGCTHKALHGPKEMAFLVCSSQIWRERYSKALGASPSGNGLFLYARSRGQAHLLPTLDCSNAIGAAAALHGLSFDSITFEFPRLVTLSAMFRLALEGSNWEFVTPQHCAWQSGICLVRPPSLLRLSAGSSTQTPLAAVALDELRGCIRVSFDYSHTEEAARILAKNLLYLGRGK